MMFAVVAYSYSRCGQQSIIVCSPEVNMVPESFARGSSIKRYPARECECKSISVREPWTRYYFRTCRYHIAFIL